MTGTAPLLMLSCFHRFIKQHRNLVTKKGQAPKCEKIQMFFDIQLELVTGEEENQIYLTVHLDTK